MQLKSKLRLPRWWLFVTVLMTSWWQRLSELMKHWMASGMLAVLASEDCRTNDYELSVDTTETPHHRTQYRTHDRTTFTWLRVQRKVCKNLTKHFTMLNRCWKYTVVTGTLKKDWNSLLELTSNSRSQWLVIIILLLSPSQNWTV